MRDAPAPTSSPGPQNPEPITQTQPATDARQTQPHDYRFAALLAGRLRASPGDLSTWVSGPVLVLDLDTGLISTACGSRALAEARELGGQFASTVNGDPNCQENFIGLPPGDAFACSTLNQDRVMSRVVIDHIDDPDHFRLRAAIVGHTQGDSLALRQQLGSQVAAARCP